MASSLVVGLIVSAFRDIALERIHYATGVESELFEYGKFIDEDRKAALEELIANKYRFYQFYGNTLIASLFLLIVRLFYANFHLWLFIFHLAIVILLFIASRDALKDMFNTYRGIVAEIDSESKDKGPSKHHVILTIQDDSDS